MPGLKWHESSEEKIYVSNQTANLHYYFVFENDKLYEIQCLHLSPNKANSDLPGFVDDFIDEYNLLDLEEYTESERMNSKANKNPGTIIVADKDTVYCVYPHTVDPSSKSIPYASLLLRDKKYSEQKATSESPSAADAGNLENETTNTPESTHAQQDKQDVKKSNDSAKIGTCKYESHLKTGDKAEVINVTALLMYESPNGKQVEGVSAFPGKEITIIGDPYCKDDVVWWKIDFLGYKGWVKEMNEEGTYYIKKR